MTRPNFELGHSAVLLFQKSDSVNQLLIDHLGPTVWEVKPPGGSRTIAAIFTHMHNVRCKWIRLTAPRLNIPSQLNRSTCTPPKAKTALAVSAASCAEMLAEALIEGRIETFHRDALAKPWPVGLEMLAYMLAHEAHHRGQICMLARQLGHPLPPKATSTMWNWEKLA